jgi:beta-lactamase class A
MTDSTKTKLVAQLHSLFEQADVDGFLHAVDVNTGAEVGYHSDAPVVAASTFKVPVLVELFRQGDAGRITLEEQVTVPVKGRALGPTGLSVMLDPASLSWRDLAQSMIAVSDNAATDIICNRIELDNVNGTMRELGLTNTRVDLNCLGIFTTMAQDAGVDALDKIPLTPSLQVLQEMRALDPAATNRTTPRDMTRLLQLVYTDEAASAHSCDRIRRILRSQVWPHRLASGFPEDDVVTAGKTGTLITWRNEVGGVEYPDGSQFVVAIYTRSHQARIKNSAADAVIGMAAKMGVDALRAG